MSTALIIWQLGHFDRFGFPHSESSAVGSLRTLYAANASYAASHPDQGYPMKLEDLLPSGNRDGRGEPDWAINVDLARGERWGYKFTYHPHPSTGGGKLDRYELYASPVESGKSVKHCFFSDQSGVIRMSERCPANSESNPLQ
jgi:hypothetical protein